MKVIKKDGTIEDFKDKKIVDAISLSAKRAMEVLTEDDCKRVVEYVKNNIKTEEIHVYYLHNLVELALDNVNPDVAKQYRNYRNYKEEFNEILDEVCTEENRIRFQGDKENSNSDSSLVATKRCLILNELTKRLYRKFFMTKSELKACNDGYIYVHDQSARLDTMNCCLFDAAKVMKGGFEMGNLWYNEPKSLDVAFDVLGDLILSNASQQYGGFTIPEIDKILGYYAEKSYHKYEEEYKNILCDLAESVVVNEESMHDYAITKVKRDFEQGFQGFEYKLNSVGSSRGDYPFITMTFGLGTSKLEQLATETFLDVHMNGQGKEGNKKPVLFPKLVFLYDEKLHGKDGDLECLFNKAIECSSKTMYPDFLSLTGEGYVPEMYKKYGEVVSPMGFTMLWLIKNPK